MGVIGAGAIGLLLASAYEQEGADVMVFTRRPAQACRLNKEGIRVDGLLSYTAEVKANTTNEAIPMSFDLLIVAVKSYDVATALQSFFQKNMAVRQWLFIQNGMSHLDIISSLQGDIYVAGVEYGVKKSTDTCVEVTGLGRIRVAPFRLFTTESFVETSFLQIERACHYKEMLEDKLIVNVCINPLTALLGVKNGALLTEPSYKQAMRTIFREAISVLNRDADWLMLWRRVVSVCQKTSDNTSSMRADYEVGRRLETEAIMGYLLKEADRKKKAAPCIAFLSHLLVNRNDH
ncbi:ketopantoate reductase [Shouchella lonarensis]|uniref:2-dehydropantoate 2-reductase n=1 Tax=Shouchella lonarensis TaxID=1464122 RepID=A0A1G6KV08_9BACI|nr:ketopantoate reductase [Shouchella lonarensis]